MVFHVAILRYRTIFTNQVAVVKRRRYTDTSIVTLGHSHTSIKPHPHCIRCHTSAHAHGHTASLLMLMLINSIYPRANLVTKVTMAAPWGLSSVNYKTVLVSTTVTLGMAVVHSNIQLYATRNCLDVIRTRRDGWQRNHHAQFELICVAWCVCRRTTM